MGLVPVLSAHSLAAAGKTRNAVMIQGKVTHQKAVTIEGDTSDETAYVSQDGFTTGRFHLMSAEDIPNALKTETRRLYRFLAAGSMVSDFDSSDPVLVGSYAPVERDRMYIASTGRTFDVVGVGSSPTDSALETCLFVAEVVTNA